jgi:hypothetical protein
MSATQKSTTQIDLRDLADAIRAHGVFMASSFDRVAEQLGKVAHAVAYRQDEGSRDDARILVALKALEMLQGALEALVPSLEDWPEEDEGDGEDEDENAKDEATAPPRQ